MEKTKVTERDIKLLNLLGQCGVMRPEQAKVVYGNVKKYHLRRVEKLVSAGMLVRDNGYIRPTQKGLDVAGFPGKPLRLQKHRYEERSIAVELLSLFSDWDVRLAREVKHAGDIQRSAHLLAVISRSSLRYAVYVLTHEPRPATVRFLRAEMRDLHHSGIERVLMFCASPAIMQAFDETPPDGLKEFCLLPYPEGVQSLKRLFSPDFKIFMNARFPGLTPSRRPFAHFEWRDAFITVLIHNDLVKRRFLKEYLEHAQKREGRRCIVVCAPNQSFPGAHEMIICHAKKGDSAACLSQA